MADTLFQLPQAFPPRKGHAADPGTGPAGQFCGTCEHYKRVKHRGQIYRKCGEMVDHWTNGPGSDIRAKDPACRYWTIARGNDAND
ncbi:MAG: hypothetical protein ABL309_13965 [Phycisphaerales bacterium]